MTLNNLIVRLQSELLENVEYVFIAIAPRSTLYGKFNDTPIRVVRKNKQRVKTFKYVYIRSTKVAKAYFFSGQ